VPDTKQAKQQVKQEAAIKARDFLFRMMDDMEDDETGQRFKQLANDFDDEIRNNALELNTLAESDNFSISDGTILFRTGTGQTITVGKILEKGEENITLMKFPDSDETHEIPSDVFRELADLVDTMGLQLPEPLDIG